MLGKWAEKYPELIVQEQREGHEVANHTFNHMYSNRSTGASKVLREMDEAEKSIIEAGAERPVLFRPLADFTMIRWCKWRNRKGTPLCSGPGIRIRGTGHRQGWGVLPKRC